MDMCNSVRISVFQLSLFGEISMQNRLTLGIFLALSAAALNSTIGIFSKVLIEQGLTIEAISFIKTIIAFVLVSIVLFRQPQKEQQQSICPHYSSTDRKSTRLNSSHVSISYAVFCLKKKNK